MSQLAAPLLTQWDRYEAVNALIFNRDLLRFYARLRLWYDTSEDEDVERDRRLTPNLNPPAFDELRRALYEPRIILPQLVQYSDELARTFNVSRNPGNQLGATARLTAEMVRVHATDVGIATARIAVLEQEATTAADRIRTLEQQVHETGDAMLRLRMDNLRPEGGIAAVDAADRVVALEAQARQGTRPLRVYVAARTWRRRGRGSRC
jgi:hypothetical protein